MTNRLAEMLRLRGMSQTELAEKTGAGTVQISRLVTGKRKLNEENVIPIAQALGVQPGDLMPLITDGSVPMPGGLTAHQKTVLAAAMTRFMEFHTNYDAKACENLGMAAVKFYLGALAAAQGEPYFDFRQLINSLALDRNTFGEDDS